MSESQETLVKQFYTFRLPRRLRQPGEALEQVNRAIAPIARSLIDAAVSPHADAWARYLLLVLRQASFLTQSAAHPSATHPSATHPSATYPIRDCQPDAAVQVLLRQQDAIAVSYADLIADLERAIAPLSRQQPDLDAIHRHVVKQSDMPDGWLFFENPGNTSQELLTAYLHPKCASVAKRWHDNEEEAFSLIQAAITDPIHVLQAFDLTRSNTSIRTYAEQTLAKRLQEKRLADAGQAKRIFSDYGRLKYSSKKDLIGALRNAGNDDACIQRYHLIWQCFKDIYQATKQPTGKQQSLPLPTPEQLAQMCDRYRQRRQALQFDHRSKNGAKHGVNDDLTVDALRNILTEMIAAIKHDAANAAVRFIKGDPDNVLHHLTNDHGRLPNPSRDGFDAFMQKENREEDKGEISAITTRLRTLTYRAFEQRDVEKQRVLLLHLGLGLVQKVIAEIEQRDPSTINRRLKREQKKLLMELVNVSQQEYPTLFQYSHDNDGAIAHLQALLEQYLQHYCKARCCVPLVQTWERLPPDQQQLALRAYTPPVDTDDLARWLRISVTQLNHHLSHLDSQFQGALMDWSQQTLAVCLTAQHLPSTCIPHLLESWLNHTLVLDDVLASVPNPLPKRI